MKALPERATLDAASRNRIQWLRHVAATVSKGRHPSGGDVIYRALVAYVRGIEQAMREGDRETLEDEMSWMLAHRCYRDEPLLGEEHIEVLPLKPLSDIRKDIQEAARKAAREAREASGEPLIPEWDDQEIRRMMEGGE